jgi:hypothetical protein
LSQSTKPSCNKFFRFMGGQSFWCNGPPVFHLKKAAKAFFLCSYTSDLMYGSATYQKSHFSTGTFCPSKWTSKSIGKVLAKSARTWSRKGGRDSTPCAISGLTPNRSLAAASVGVLPSYTTSESSPPGVVDKAWTVAFVQRDNHF